MPADRAQMAGLGRCAHAITPTEVDLPLGGRGTANFVLKLAYTYFGKLMQSNFLDHLVLASLTLAWHIPPGCIEA